MNDLCDSRSFLRWHFVIGVNTPDVVHGTAVGSPEFFFQRVGHRPHRTIFTTVSIVKNLDAAPRRGIVFCNGDLDLGVVGQWLRRLNKTLTERFLADYDPRS